MEYALSVTQPIRLPLMNFNEFSACSLEKQTSYGLMIEVSTLKHKQYVSKKNSMTQRN